MASFFVLCVHAHMQVSYFLYICVLTKPTTTHKRPSTRLPQLSCLLLSVDLIYYTHTSLSTTGRDHKSKASSSLAAKKKKTHGCFSPTKRAINSVSQGVTHSSGRLCTAGIAHTAHLPFSLRFSNKICVDS